MKPFAENWEKAAVNRVNHRIDGTTLDEDTRCVDGGQPKSGLIRTAM